MFGLLGVPATASAHVIVQPSESPAGTTQLFAIAVPSEKRSDTIRVEIQFPRTLIVLQVLAPAGWQVTAQKDGSGRIISEIQDAGLEVLHAENFRHHYAMTLRDWCRNLVEHWDAAVDEVGVATAKVWGLYMAAARVGFERNNLQLHHVLASNVDAWGDDSLP